MTQRNIQKPKPTLFIKRFLVLKSGKFAYDQKFKMGVNIIRGDNGTGKSTIMDLIYYALGAEVTEWTDEQELCDATLVEILLNYKLFCLKREITETGKAAMYFYDGSAEEALESSLDWVVGWPAPKISSAFGAASWLPDSKPINSPSTVGVSALFSSGCPSPTSPRDTRGSSIKLRTIF